MSVVSQCKPLTIGEVVLDSPVVLAPMSGVSDYPFRKIVKGFGAGLVVSEMVASRAVIEALKSEAVRKRLKWFDPAREQAPVSVQIVGYDPAIMAEAARFNEDLGAHIIDINMGCPVRKVVNTDSGAALMKDEALAREIIRAVVRAVRVPVTVKMRLGWDAQHKNAATLAHIAELEGVRAVTIHGRTRAQLYEGRADWRAIRAIKEAVSIPVIGNGDVTSLEEATQLLEESGADGVMIGRGSYGRPWLLHQVGTFLQTGNRLPDPTPSEIRATIDRHLALIMEEYGEYKGVRIARKHLSWYSKGLSGSAEFRQRVNACEAYEGPGGLKDLMNNFFS